MTTQVKVQWSSRLKFILAVIGMEVGLGNLWRFPFVAGENGGGAFVLLYIFFLIFFAFPAQLSMIMIGRRAQQSPINAFRKITEDEGRHWIWGLSGWVPVILTFFAFTYFSVVASWSLEYTYMAATNALPNVDPQTSKAAFNALLADPWRMGFWLTVFIGLTVSIVIAGIRNGLEKAISIMMPSLFLIMLLLITYAMFVGDFVGALRFLFIPDFSAITADVVMNAMTQAIFSLSVGGAGALAYGSYLSKQVRLGPTVAIIAGADTLVALAAGLMIFPFVFSAGLTPSAGPGLIFITLPVAIANLPGGYLLSMMFFLLLVFATLTTSIAMVESTMSWMMEKLHFSRRLSVSIIGITAWIIGLANVLSFNIWAELKPLGFIPRFADKNIFTSMDDILANMLLPTSGVLMVVFAGWVMSAESSREELGFANERLFKFWRFLARYLIPLALISTFFANMI